MIKGYKRVTKDTKIPVGSKVYIMGNVANGTDIKTHHLKLNTFGRTVSKYDGCSVIVSGKYKDETYKDELLTQYIMGHQLLVKE